MHVSASARLQQVERYIFLDSVSHGIPRLDNLVFSNVKYNGLPYLQLKALLAMITIEP